jgi:uncharacterized protein
MSAPQPVWKMMPSGRMVDLMAPSAAEIDFSVDIPVALSRIARFDGAIGHGPACWSVLDHAVEGAKLLRPTAGDEAAAAFLLHDLHEAYVGDIATPVAKALAGWAGLSIVKPGYAPGFIVGEAITAMKAAQDRAIHAAAGCAWPLPPAIRAIVKRHDVAMMMTEARHMGPTPWRPWDAALVATPSLPTRGALRPAPPQARIAEFLTLLDDLCPAARKRAAPGEMAAFAEPRRTRR